MGESPQSGCGGELEVRMQTLVGKVGALGTECSERVLWAHQCINQISIRYTKEAVKGFYSLVIQVCMYFHCNNNNSQCD